MSRSISLEMIEVRRPCPASWEGMERVGEAGRFCTHCNKTVHDLTSMTRDEAEELVCRAAGRLCVRLARDEAGAVVTLDYQPAKGRGRTWRFWTMVATCGAAVAGVVNAMFFRAEAPAPPTPPAMRFMVGDICLPPTPTAPGNGGQDGSAQPETPARS